MQLIAVNGQEWRPENLREAIDQAKGNSKPIELLIKNAGYFKTFTIHYHDGQRYPHLERDAARPDLLEKIIQPRAAQAAGKRE